MAASSFSEVVRTVRLYASTAPLFLVREWVNAAYKELCGARRWAFLRGETTIVVQDARTLDAVGVTQGSTTVTSAALFVAGDVGRQFRVGTFPFYTVVTFTDASTIVLDRPYGAATDAAAAGTILDAYVTLPADFGSFRLVADMYNRRPLPFWATDEQLLVVDPKREYSGTPRAILPATRSPISGAMRYELWPPSLSARAYPALYNKQEDNLTDSDTFAGVLADGGQVLVNGALAKAARWPGSPDQKNPYFSVPLAQQLDRDFAAGIQTLSLRDDEQAPDDLARVDWTKYDSLARTDLGLRSSDATLDDYWG